jgi:predicted transcriptional regulator of viral defense system
MRGAPAVRPDIGAKLQVDRTIAALAARQHGLVTRAQLLRLGLGRRAIGHRLACGRLHVVHRGVYAVGHPVLSRAATWLAAVLAVGDAVLSHRSAAALWGIRMTARSRVEVSVTRPSRSRPRIHVHAARLTADETTVADAIPVTTPARTLLDLAALLPPSRLERAVNEAEVLRLADATSLASLVARYPHRPGVPAIRRILEAGGIGAAITRSELEDRFLAFLDRAGLPPPELNVRLELPSGWIEADCVWREQRVVVELDGYAAHGTRVAFERDRARDRMLQAAGWSAVRVTWRHIHHEAATLESELRALLLQLGPS